LVPDPWSLTLRVPRTEQVMSFEYRRSWATHDSGPEISAHERFTRPAAGPAKSADCPVPGCCRGWLCAAESPLEYGSPENGHPAGGLASASALPGFSPVAGPVPATSDRKSTRLN